MSATAGATLCFDSAEVLSSKSVVVQWFSTLDELPIALWDCQVHEDLLCRRHEPARGLGSTQSRDPSSILGDGNPFVFSSFGGRRAQVAQTSFWGVVSTVIKKPTAEANRISISKSVRLGSIQAPQILETTAYQKQFVKSQGVVVVLCATTLVTGAQHMLMR
ncbi:hypothetical protein IWZ00DRAFT_108672 [Phyllosticta capitalensis]|uniref:Uncharacterized protein n=1 Tax=Phyllosticta capitalensis TaxID=121624 RepID=A0ABR1YDA7_9PEZI